MFNRVNKVSKALAYIAMFIYIVFLIVGFMLFDGPFGDFEGTIAAWIIGIINGTLFLAVSEIIELLDKISNK